MALPILPLLGGLMRGAASFGSRMGIGRGVARSMQFGAGRGGTSAGGTGGAGGQSNSSVLLQRLLGQRDRPQRLQFDVNALARRLGTPNPSQKQIDKEHDEIRQHNQKVDWPSSPGGRAVGALVTGVKVTAFASAIAGATKGLIRLGESANDAAVEQMRKYSPLMSALAMQKELFAMRYQAERASLVGGSTERLSRLQMQRQKMYQPYGAARENLANNLREIPEKTAIGFATILDKLGIKDAVDNYNRSQSGGDPDKSALLNVINKYKTGWMIGDNQTTSRRPNEQPRSRF